MFKLLMRSARSIAKVADELGDFTDRGSKPRYIWEAYEPYLRPLADRPIRLLEVGLHKGASMRVLATYFSRGTIVGIDVALPAGLSAFDNVILECADQRDPQRLTEVCERQAPGGFDVIIDDASHIGAWSRTLFLSTFPHLKPGGLYVIEDWGTAYMPTWPDGAAAIAPSLTDEKDAIPRRIMSHEFGMAGFIKSLIDEFAADEQPFEWMHICSPLAVLKKSSHTPRPNAAVAADSTSRE